MLGCIAAARRRTGLPAPTGNASFQDGLGVTVTVPVLGQPLTIIPGPFSGIPTSYDYQVYAAGVAITGENGTWNAGDPPPIYTPTDDLIGVSIDVRCHGINGVGTSSTTSNSAATSPVVDRDLTNAITAFSRTTVSGFTPMGFSVTFGPGVYQGDIFRFNVFSDSGLSTETESIGHVLSYDDLQPGAVLDLASDGLTAVGATDWAQVGVEATSPHGTPYSFTYPDAISPTDASVAMTWSATDKDSNVIVSGGNLLARGNGGVRGASVRTNRGVSSGKVYAEFAATFSGALTLGVADSSASLTTLWTAAFADGAATTDAGAWTSNDDIYYNGSPAGSGGFSNTDNIDIALDVGAKKAWFRKNNGSWLPSGDPAAGTGGLSMASISTPIYFGAQFSFSATDMTANFGPSFTRTPPSGFSAP